MNITLGVGNYLCTIRSNCPHTARSGRKANPNSYFVIRTISESKTSMSGEKLT